MTDKRGNPALVKGGPSLNPAGRPKGSSNARTKMQNELIESFHGELEKEFKAVVRKIIRKAKDGDMAASKLLLDRVLPARKSVEHYGPQEAGGITINIAGLKEGHNPMKIDQQSSLTIEGDLIEEEEDNV